MASRPLELEVMQGSRHAGTFEVNADPDDAEAMRRELVSWLESRGWKEPTWGKFSLLVRHAGEYKVRKTIRPVP